jgi:hypothetical protein
MAQFDLAVAKNGETKLQYRVRYKFKCEVLKFAM